MQIHKSLKGRLAGERERGPVTALTSACKVAPSQVGRFKCGVMGSCCSSDFSVQQSPTESRSFGVMGSCCRTDRSVQQGPIAVLFSLVQWKGFLLQH